ncbi:MAG: hypothetical protein ACYDC5_12515 [Candidatus Dormibacteria bacterium]
MPTRERSVAVLSAPVGAATRRGAPARPGAPLSRDRFGARGAAGRAGARLAISQEAIATALDTEWLVPHGYYLLRAGPPPSIQAPTARGAASRPTAIEVGKDLEGVVVYDQRLTAAAGAAVIRTVTPT